GPGLRTTVRKLVLAVAQIGAERAVGDAVGEDGIGKQLVLLYDGPVDRLDKSLALRAQPVGLADRGDIRSGEHTSELQSLTHPRHLPSFPTRRSSDLGPGLRTTVRKLVLAVAQIGAERAVGDAVGEDGIGKQLVLLYDGPVDRLDKSLALRAQPVGLADRGDI